MYNIEVLMKLRNDIMAKIEFLIIFFSNLKFFEFFFCPDIPLRKLTTVAMEGMMVLPYSETPYYTPNIQEGH